MKKFISHVFRPGTGRTVPSASVHVKANPSTSGSADVTVYSDAAGSSPITQPFLTSSNGRVEFYAPDGRYDLYFTITDPTFGTITDNWIDVSIDSSDTTTAIVSTVTGGHFVLTTNDITFPNRVVMPMFLGHPDSPPVSPSSQDNEFDTSVAGWGNVGTDGNTVIALTNGRLHLTQVTTTRTAPNVGYEKAFSDPGTDFTLTAFVRLGYHPGLNGTVISGQKPFFGIGIKSNLAEIAGISLGGGSQGISVFRTDYNSGGLILADQAQIVGSNACYVRIRRVSTNYFFEWSVGGLSFVTIDQKTSIFSGSYAAAGLYAYANFDTGGSIDCYADFFRKS
jgi:hypothetical protein